VKLEEATQAALAQIIPLLNVACRERMEQLLGTDPNERWAGYDSIMKIIKTQTAQIGGMSAVADPPEAFVEGTVGWVADRLNLKLSERVLMDSRYRRK
jgi:hypothetical protein